MISMLSRYGERTGRKILTNFTLRILKQWLAGTVHGGNEKKDGAEYPTKSVYLILCGLRTHIREKGTYETIFLMRKTQN